VSYQVNWEIQAQDLIAIRDTKDRTGPALRFAARRGGGSPSR
jgi:hypothetical protein